MVAKKKATEKQKKFRHAKKKKQKPGERKSASQVNGVKKIEKQIQQKNKKTSSSSSNGNSSTSSSQQNGASNSSVFQQALSKKLAGAKFRMINEQLYTKTGSEAREMFEKNPELFTQYHEGFKNSIEQWPFDPVSNLIKWLNKKPKKLIVADFGCGEARIALEAKQTTIHSFDLVALNDRVTVCDIAHVPLEDESVDIGIFSLSLMGTNFLDYLKEAYRVLKKEATLKIVELESRFSRFEAFKRLVQRMGFDLKHQLNPDSYFVVFEFVKNSQRQPIDVSKVDPLTILKPCLYKNR